MPVHVCDVCAVTCVCSVTCECVQCTCECVYDIITVIVFEQGQNKTQLNVLPPKRAHPYHIMGSYTGQIEHVQCLH